jgi:SEC-C motif-containing protein
MSGKSFRQNSKVIWPGFTDISPRHVAKVGRNEACPCGSKKKYKDCHESEGTPFLEKLAREKDRERTKEMRQRMKEQGVPWYKRMFVRP